VLVIITKIIRGQDALSQGMRGIVVRCAGKEGGGGAGAPAGLMFLYRARRRWGVRAARRRWRSASGTRGHGRSATDDKPLCRRFQSDGNPPCSHAPVAHIWFNNGKKGRRLAPHQAFLATTVRKTTTTRRGRQQLYRRGGKPDLLVLGRNLDKFTTVAGRAEGEHLHARLTLVILRCARHPPTLLHTALAPAPHLRVRLPPTVPPPHSAPHCRL
jgi:hypothetical protein